MGLANLVSPLSDSGKGISKLLAAKGDPGLQNLTAIDEEEKKKRMSVGMKKGGVTRADGIAQRGKTRGKMY